MLRRIKSSDEEWDLLEKEKKKPNQSRKYRNRVLIALLLIFVIYLLYTFKPVYIGNRNPRYSLSLHTKHVTYINRDEDERLIDYLRNSKIVQMERYDAGLSDKFICVLESGHQVLIKPMEEWHYLDRIVPVWDAKKLPVEANNNIGRANNEYQGWSEVMGFYLDRALDFYRKPPITGRLITNKELYGNDSYYDTFWRKYLPEHQIPVSIALWIDGSRRAPPSNQIRDYLTSPSAQIQIPREMRRAAKGTSNKIIFDYLLDDHDSQNFHNYLVDANGDMLNWDSGLAWRHGPNARENCTLLLCGMTNWLDEAKNANRECKKICVFDKKTVTTMSTFKANRNLIDKMYSMIVEDPTFPITNYGYYHIETHARKWYYYGKVTFKLKNYLEGIQKRLEILMSHVDDCLYKYNENTVLIE